MRTTKVPGLLEATMQTDTLMERERAGQDLIKGLTSIAQALGLDATATVPDIAAAAAAAIKARNEWARQCNLTSEREADLLHTTSERHRTIALAAGLGADATEEEVAKRVGEMRGALVGWATDAPGSADALDALADRLATEAGHA